jgi:predicted alpha/beta superfamily hydrolase
MVRVHDFVSVSSGILRTRHAVTLLCCVFAITVRAQDADARATSPTPTQVVIPATEQIDFTSKINRRTYRLFIARPALPALAAGLPVLYVLDGNAYFGVATQVARTLSLAGEVKSALVVGIGYATDDFRAIGTMRARDLTLPPSAKDTAQMPGVSVSDVGGADAFLQVIEQEIKPRIASIAHTDPSQAVLLGHSLGGLTVVRALFREPSAYRTFIAVSPSLFWAERAVLGDERDFLRQVNDLKVAPRLLICVGGKESTPLESVPAGAGVTLERANELIRTARMVEEAQGLAERLAASKGLPGYHVEGAVLPAESHQSAPFAAMSRAIRFAFDSTKSRD